jgi:hypothetical protein
MLVNHVHRVVAPEAAGSNPVAHPRYYEGLAPGADPFFLVQGNSPVSVSPALN